MYWILRGGVRSFLVKPNACGDSPCISIWMADVTGFSIQDVDLVILGAWLESAAVEALAL